MIESAGTLRQTPLHDWHVERGGRMVDFAGWSMPVQYTSIVAEHTATRQAAAMFDVSHMGRLRFDGNDAAQWLDRLLTRKVSDLRPGRIRYSLITNEQGKILDDVLAYHNETRSGRRYHMLVVNASNREKIIDWLKSHADASLDVEISDRTVETAMLAVQGPRALDIISPLLDADPSKLKYYQSHVTQLMGRTCIVSRTGYTGEDGCELIVTADDANDVAANLFRSGDRFGLQPAGLGARDTLRLEAAMPLYGHELSEQIDPFQAGLAFAVQLEDRDFVGRQALITCAREAKNSDAPQRIGLKIDGRRPAREHYPIYYEEQEVGQVTSGTHSPTLHTAIAMGYVRHPECKREGCRLQVDVRGTRQTATVVPLPFYQRS